jgi:hypothetical protein
MPTIVSGQSAPELMDRPMQKTGRLLWLLASIVVEKQKEDAFVAAFSNNSRTELRSRW